MADARERLAAALAVALALVVPGCGGSDRPEPPPTPPPTSAVPSREGGLQAFRTAEGILLGNRDTVPLYVAMYDARVLPFIEWAPCTDPATCEGIRPGERRVETLAPEVSDTVVVFWWRLIAGPGGVTVPDSVRAMPIPVR
jgi:hypothetical protein